MVKALPLLGGVVSIVSLVLFAVGIATNHWVVLHATNAKLNPLLVNSQLEVARLLFLVAALLMIIGVATQLVGIFNSNRTLAMLSGIIIFLAGLIVMTAFAVLYSEEMAKNGVKKIARIGWSFWLMIASWPLALLAGLISCFMASVGLKYKEVSDYSASGTKN